MKIDRSKKFNNHLTIEGDFFTKVNGFREVDFLVLHHIEAISVDHAISQLLAHKVSAHFIINKEGQIFELVDENDIAYHAGVSNWRNVEGLNSSSIGIEFINSHPFEDKFTEEQMISGVELTKYLAAKYAIEARNIVGHSDIAYHKESRLLDRKQDPSHLFDWKFLAENGVGIKIDAPKNDEVLFKFGDCDQKLKIINENLDRFGYAVMNLNNEFDEEMRCLARVFNRRFIGVESDVWRVDSQMALDKLMKIIDGKN